MRIHLRRWEVVAISLLLVAYFAYFAIAVMLSPAALDRLAPLLAQGMGVSRAR